MAGVVGLAGHQRQRAEVGQVVLDALLQLRQVGGIEGTTQDDRALNGESVDGGGVQWVVACGAHRFFPSLAWVAQ